MTTPRRPQALLFDYGGTLVEEVAADTSAGTEAILAHAIERAPGTTLDRVLARAARVNAEVAALRDQHHVETPWPALTRLIHDPFGTRFDRPIAELELVFWKATVTTRGMPGARAALDNFHAAGIPMAVVSNSSFGPDVIRYEIDKHGLAQHLKFVMVSAEYAVRKPNPLLFDTAAARLGIAPADIWFVGDRLDTDVAGARQASMTAVLFDPRRNVPAADADLTVSSWTRLAELVLISRGHRASRSVI